MRMAGPIFSAWASPARKRSGLKTPKGAAGHWPRHVALDVTDNESPLFADITGDGRAGDGLQLERILRLRRTGLGQPRPSLDLAPHFARTTITTNTTTASAWATSTAMAAPISSRKMAGGNSRPRWPTIRFGSIIPFTFARRDPGVPVGSAQMFAYDVNGDGLNDVITSLAAHGYGLAWYEQVREDGASSFKPHIFMNKEPRENKYGVKFTQIHALDLVDMDGDGLKDIVTGKRFWAHGPEGDPEPNAPAVLYWFRLTRPGGGWSIGFRTASTIIRRWHPGRRRRPQWRWLARCRRRQQTGHLRFHPATEPCFPGGVGAGPTQAAQPAVMHSGEGAAFRSRTDVLA